MARPASILSVLVLLVLALLFISAAPAHAGDGWWGGLDEGEAVSLADVMRGPRAYRDRMITFFAVFHTADGEFKYYPTNTPFSEQRHVNFSAWPDGAVVWSEKGFKNDLPFLYLRRTHAQRTQLLRLPAFTRIEVTGKVREIVSQRPAIEVFSYRATGHRLGKKVVTSILDGNAYARAGTTQGYQMAARSFKDALRPDLPPAYDMMVRKLLGDTLRKLGFRKEASQYENGESVGLPELPKPDPTQDVPQPPDMGGDMPEPFNPDVTGDGPRPARPGGGTLGLPPSGAAPMPFGDPDGDQPDASTPRPRPTRRNDKIPTMPDAPLGFDEEPAPTSRGPRDGGPAPAPSWRPGDAQPPAAMPPTALPTTKPKARIPVPSAAARSGIPPKRRPRLSGVK